MGKSAHLKMHHYYHKKSKNKNMFQNFHVTVTVKSSLTSCKSSIWCFLLWSVHCYFGRPVTLKHLLKRNREILGHFVLCIVWFSSLRSNFLCVLFLITREPKEGGTPMDISITPSSLQVKTPADCTELRLPAEVRLVPSSCRGLQYVAGDGLHLRLQVWAESNASKWYQHSCFSI